jgi:hypothetical protein
MTEPWFRPSRRLFDVEGRDVAWLLEAPLEGAEDETTDPLALNFRADQFPEEEREFAETGRAIEDMLADGIFDLRNGPRHVLVFGLSQIVLVDRHKWPARSVLRFDLQEIFSRQDPDTLAVMACLISREARVPHQGVPIADRIEEEAQRNANTVTTSLKRTVRDAIEILGQEVLDVTGGKYPTGPRKGVWIDGPELSLECLRYMYRMLFLFYAEANPRLNVLDLKDLVYASGYSIEALRELEMVRLRTPVEKTGTYLWESLQRILGLLYSGNAAAIRLPAVKISLLDPGSTPILTNSIRTVAGAKGVARASLSPSQGAHSEKWGNSARGASSAQISGWHPCQTAGAILSILGSTGFVTSSCPVPLTDFRYQYGIVAPNSAPIEALSRLGINSRCGMVG